MSDDKHSPGYFVVGDLVVYVGYDPSYVETDRAGTRLGIILSINQYYDTLYRIHWLDNGYSTDVTADNIRLLYVKN